MTHLFGAARAEQPIAPLPEPPKAWASGHSVQLYESEEFLATSVSSFLAEGVSAGQPVLIVATPDHAQAFLAGMRSRRVDVDELVVGRDILVLDAQEVLAQIMKGASPDPAKFEAAIGQSLRRLSTDRPYVVVRAYGEMVDLLWRAGNITAALELEELWNDIALRLRRKDGAIRRVLMSSNVMWQDGKFVHTRCFSRDITGVTLPIA